MDPRLNRMDILTDRRRNRQHISRPTCKPT